MIPLRDTIPSRTVPVVTWTLIALNLLVFAFQISSGSGVERIFGLYALTPARLLGGESGGPERYLPLMTSMFLHGGWLHVIGNMLYLHIFGDNVEDTIGHARFALFYLTAGVVSALSQVVAEPGSTIPMVGASGAVAGVLGAYFVLFHHARIVTLVPIFIFFQAVEVPAFFFLLFWFLLQFVSGAISSGVSTASAGGVAWWAHVGGFATGLVVGLVLRVSRASRRGRR